MCCSAISLISLRKGTLCVPGTLLCTRFLYSKKRAVERYTAPSLPTTPLQSYTAYTAYTLYSYTAYTVYSTIKGGGWARKVFIGGPRLSRVSSVRLRYMELHP